MRLPLLSKDGDIHEEEIEKWNTMSRSSLDSASSITLSSCSISTGNNNNYADNSSVPRIVGPPPSISDNAELGVGGVPNRFLGITPSFLWQVQPQQTTMAVVFFLIFFKCSQPYSIDVLVAKVKLPVR